MTTHGMAKKNHRPRGEPGRRHQRIRRHKMVLEIIKMDRQRQLAKMSGTPLPGPVDDQHIMATCHQPRRHAGIFLTEFRKAGADDDLRAGGLLRWPVMTAHMAG